MTKQEEILTAASECFSNYGYSKTSMSDIGKRVGINKASIYYHFKDKLAIYEAVIEGLMIEHRLNMKQSIAKLKSNEDKIIQLICLEIDFWSDIAITHHFTGNDEKDDTNNIVTRALAQNQTIMSRVIEDGIKDEEFIVCNPNETASMIMKVGRGLLLVNCPLYLPKDKVQEGYDLAKVEIEFAIRLLIHGLHKK